MATAIHDVTRSLSVEQIRVPANVRELDTEHVEALAGSIRLQGVLVPLVVRPLDDAAFELVAGFTGSRPPRPSA